MAREQLVRSSPDRSTFSPSARARAAIIDIGTELSCSSGNSLCTIAGTSPARHAAASIGAVRSSTPRPSATLSAHGPSSAPGWSTTEAL